MNDKPSIEKVTGYVYLIGIEDARILGRSPLKVGIAQNVSARVSSHQSSNPFKLVLYGTWQFPDILVARRFELKFHKVFRKQCISGEWFDITISEASAALDRFRTEYVMRSEPDGDQCDAFVILGPDTFAAVRPKVSATTGMSANQRRYRRYPPPTPRN